MFIDNILNQSWFFQVWFLWLTSINLASIIFLLVSSEARWIFAIWLIHIWSLFFYNFLYEEIEISYMRFIALSQIILWTPLLLYLLLRLRHMEWPSASSKYVMITLLSNLIALILDYRSLALWLLGEYGAQL